MKNGPLPTNKEHRILKVFNDTNATFPTDKTIVDLFLNQVERAPDSIAVVFNDNRLTYGELDQRSNRLAHYLIDIHGLAVGNLVGLMLERSELLIVSMLAILKTGAAYVPIDPEHPPKRKSHIQNDSKCKVTVDTTLLNDFNRNKDAYASKEHPEIDLKPNDLAYIMYTSGTTGNPKGVMIEHRSVVNLIFSQTELFKIGRSERILQFSNYFFDASVEQIFLALLNGATLVLIGSEKLRNHVLVPFLEKHAITHLHATPSYLETLPDLSHLKTLKRIIAGGETCSLKLAKKLAGICDFYNEYGPTEATVTATVYKYTTKNKAKKSLSIGKPIGNTKAYILADTLVATPVGEVGELYLAGSGLARGYLNLPKLTSEKFVKNPFESTGRMYRTGDLAKWLPDGNIAFIGRKDDQVKLRGYRIELGEIETTLNSLPYIKRATVVLNTDLAEEPRLVAYLVATGPNADTNAVRQQLAETLPDYMLPTTYTWLDTFPTTSNGKIDKKNLQRPTYQRPSSAPILKKPRTQLEKKIAKIWSELLQVPTIGIDDNFFEMGGTSLLAIKVSTLLTKSIKSEVPVTKIYQHQTIAKLSAYLEAAAEAKISRDQLPTSQKKSSTDIAIIGMAGRFPGAQSIDELWEVLKDGKETISFFKPEELDASLSGALTNDPLYVRARGIVPSAQTFDAAFFSLSPKLAEAMDPQQRLFLEIAWEALEQTGHLPEHYKGSIGVYAGTGINTYYKNNVLPNNELLLQVGHLQADTVNEKDYVASRTSYHLDLKGPAVSVHSACSTSLLAIAEAVEAIRNGQCDAALAGGSSITAPIYSGHRYQEGSMLSPDGHCRSFDKEGKGTVFSDGAGVVLLKSLDAARKDGDFIYGLIKGVGLNNDGGNKGSFTAPSVEGQADAIRKALNDAKISPASINYVEAHGTATPLGDPIEIEGLRMAFGEQEKNGYCALGSIKSNMGHLTAAAGVAGLIKTVLAMNHRQLPPSLGYSEPNPSIDFENSPFYVNAKLRDWQADDILRAGVSSFGVGGTNVHIVLEEYVMETKASDAGRPLQLVPWSAKTETSLEGYGTVLGNYLDAEPDIPLADVAYSLNMTRASFGHRSFIVADNVNTASPYILNKNNKLYKTDHVKVVPNEVVFLFPGQGAQYVQMGRELYEHEKVFSEAVDICAELLKDCLKTDIRKLIFSDKGDDETLLKDTRFTQPALFVIEYALAQLWISWGIKPTAICGHSIGEFVGAHLAGILSLKDALHLVMTRGRLVSELPAGSMLSVRMDADHLEEILPDSLSVAAINSDRLCVVAGQDKDIEKFIRKLKKEAIPHMLLATSHAFHSAMMDPVLEPFGKEVAKITLNTPKIPIVSTVKGKWLADAEATNPQYWTDHLRATVRFSEAMDTVLDLEDPVLLEVGPGHTLTTLTKQKKKAKGLASIASLPVPKKGKGAYSTILNALGELWLKGLEPDWHAFYNEQSRQKVRLPAYFFDRKPCWVEPISKEPAQEVVRTVKPSEKTVSRENHQTVVPRKVIILKKITEIVANTSGIEIEADEANLNFLELGLDSLILTQIALACKREFDIPVSFRQLNEEFGTPALLAEHLEVTLPAEVFAPEPIVAHAQSQSTDFPSAIPNQVEITGSNQNSTFDNIAQQLQELGRQVQLLQGKASASKTSKTNGSQIKNSLTRNSAQPKVLTTEEKLEHKKAFGAAPRIERQSTELNETQLKFLENLIQRYNKKTRGSKNYAQKHRAKMSDPRVVTGFKPQTKELIYPLVIEKSSGNRLWDLDGNEYIDALNGFGSCLFGHQPDFIKEALHKQVELGFEVGPQHPLAGEVCELLCEFTGHERAALCNTGSEAVLGAMRIARTVTGRSLVVAFSSSYHGINDEVIVRGSRMLKTFPAAPGILPEAVQNMLILDYGSDESLRIIRERAHELAAVLVEPIQSRRPELQPVDFLKEVREITAASETVLIFDEIITGFRMHPGGVQAMFDIKADIATYGKVIGGGISIGAIVGKREYMDALDGGYWQYGDDSYPEVGVTYFAGTFVRHPLALATTKASLNYMKEQGPDLQNRLSAMTESLAFELNTRFIDRAIPMQINYFGSLWRLKFKEEIPYSELLFVLMREKGIHIWDGFPCYMTDAYTEKDIEILIEAFMASVDELINAGILTADAEKKTPKNQKRPSEILNTPPLPGARLGRDKLGNPAWFVANTKEEGEYVKIDL